MRDFNIGIKDFADAVGASVEDIAAKIAMDAYAGVVQRTPVDTGRARGAWTIEQDGPADWTIANNVEYIQALENGHSQQAPTGMVAVTLAGIETDLRDMIQQTFRRNAR